jgi:WD40 repeat protein
LEDPLPDGAFARLGTGRYRVFVRLARLSPDGRLLAGPDRRGGIQILETASGKAVRRLNAGPGAAQFAFDPSGQTLAVAGYDGIVHLWDLGTAQEVRQINERQIQAADLAFSGDGKVLALCPPRHGQDAPIQTFDVATGKRLSSFQGLHTMNGGVALSRDGKTLASWGFGRFTGRESREETIRISQTVQIWDTTTGKEVRQIQTDRGSITSAGLSPDGKTVALVTGNFTLQLWDLAEGKLQRAFQTRYGIGMGLFYSPDGRFLVATGHDGAIQGWDTATWKRLSLHSGPTCQWSTLAFAPDGGILVGGQQGQALVLWDAVTGRVLTPRGGHEGSIAALAFSPDGQEIFTAGSEGKIIQWATATAKEARVYEEVVGENDIRRHMRDTAFLFSLDLKYLVSASNIGGLRVRSLITGEEAFRVQVFSRLPQQLVAALSPDGTLLAVPGWNQQTQTGSVHLLDVSSGQELAPLEGHPGQVVALALSPDGKTLVVGSLSQGRVNPAGQAFFLEAWPMSRAAKGRRLAEMSAGNYGHGAHVLTYSPDGKMLAVGQPMNTVSLVDPSTGEPLYSLGGTVQVSALTFASNSRVVAVAGTRLDNSENVVSVWETATGKKRWEKGFGANPVTALAFSPDGKVLGTGHPDTTVLLWDLAGQRLPTEAGPKRLSATTLANLWEALASSDAVAAYHAMQRLTRAPADAIPFLKDQLRPAEKRPVDSKEIARLISELDHDQFTKREEALRRLQAIGPPALEALHQALANKPSTEMKRRGQHLIALLEKPGVPVEMVRPLRALEVLEWIGSREVQKVLEGLSKGQPEAMLTQEAKAVLRRLGPKP